MFEKPEAAKAEGRNNIEKIEHFIEELSLRYQNENIPVGNDGRIDMESYADMYPDLEKDLERNKMWEDEWKKNGSNPDRRRTDGERLEMLAHAIFAKNLGDRFIVARSSPHDDWVNKVDTVVLDRETGNLICAFDEVGDISGPNYEKKQRIVQEHNLKGGASLKYGIGIDEKDGRKNVVMSFEDNIPIFYVALPKDHIDEGISKFVPDATIQSDFEKQLFTYFVSTLSAQANGLELYRGRLNPALKTKLTAFKKVLADLSLKQEKRK